MIQEVPDLLMDDPIFHEWKRDGGQVLDDKRLGQRGVLIQMEDGYVPKGIPFSRSRTFISTS